MVVLASTSSFVFLAGGPRVLLTRGILTHGDKGGCPIAVLDELDDLVILGVEL
jgi:hypothetical protein